MDTSDKPGPPRCRRLRMNEIVVNGALVLVFVLMGGVFAATEIALVSLREGQIRRLEQRGGRGARTAALARNPNRFLSAVQIGVTVAGFFSAAYGASTIAPAVSPALVSWGGSRLRRHRLRLWSAPLW